MADPSVKGDNEDPRVILVEVSEDECDEEEDRLREFLRREAQSSVRSGNYRETYNAPGGTHFDFSTNG